MDKAQGFLKRAMQEALRLSWAHVSGDLNSVREILSAIPAFDLRRWISSRLISRITGHFVVMRQIHELKDENKQLKDNLVDSQHNFLLETTHLKYQHGSIS